MRSLGPSERYDRAQHASVMISSSLSSWVGMISVRRVVRAALVTSKSGAGLPRQKLLSVHVALRTIERLAGNSGARSDRRGVMAPDASTKSAANNDSLDFLS